MSNLTTRKIVLGMLMTLVLAFGVQSVADAVTDPSITVNGEDDILTEKLRKVYGTFTITTLGSFTDDNPTKKESVKITKSSGIRFTGTYTGQPSITLEEDAEDGSITGITSLGGSFTAIGRQWVKISGNDYEPKGTNPETYTSESWSYTYIYYVTQPGSSTTTVSLRNTGYSIGIPVNSDIPVHTGSGNYAVTYTVSGGSLVIRDSDTRDGESFTLTKTGTSNADLVASSAFDVYLITTGTAEVTAQVEGSGVKTVATYIVGAPTLTVGHPGDPDGNGNPDDAVAGSKASPGLINNRLPAEPSPTNRAFTATVTDGINANVPGVVVTFRAGGSGTGGGRLVFNSPTNAGTLVSSNNRERLDSNGLQIPADTAKTLYVRTDKNGKADVDFLPGTDRKQDVTISAIGQSKTVSAYTGSGSGNQLVNPRSQKSQVSGRAGEYELRVDVEDEDGTALSGQYVEFRTNDGTLDDPALATDLTNLGSVRVETDTQGIAFIFFDPGETSGSLRVTAHLLDLGAGDALGGTGDEADTVIDDVVFDIRGGSPPPPPPPSGTQQRLDISVFGDDGDTSRPVIVNVLNSAGQSVSISIPVTLSGTALVTSQTVNTGAVTTITLPTAADTYTLIATDPAGNYNSDTETITVGEPEADGEISIEAIGAPAANLQQTVEVTVTNAAGTGVEDVEVTLAGPSFVTRTITTLADGSVRGLVTIPSASGTHILTARAPGYSSDTVTLSASGVVQQDDTQSPSTTTGGEASRVRISSEAFPSGLVDEELDTPLSVQVLDANNRGVSDVKVTFRATPGRGRLSQRGNGSANVVQTDRTGYARTNYTPLVAGTSTVRVTARGVTQTVTFTITASGGTTTPTTTTTRDTGTTTTTTVSPVVRVPAGSRPAMYWIDTSAGTLHRLVGADVENIAPTVQGATSLAMGRNQKIYWTAPNATNARRGSINSANLDGSGASVVRDLFGAPLNIAVTSDALYWTDALGRVQRSNLDGSEISNVVPGLTNPGDIAIAANGRVYWTEAAGSIRSANISGSPRVVQNVATGLGEPLSIAIGGGKIYWLERAENGSGKLQRANLDGSSAEELRAFAVLYDVSIAVDAAGQKIYLTGTGGKITRRNLNGLGYQEVATGLSNPGSLVTGGATTAVAVTTPTTTTTTTTTTTDTDNSKYDVNGDGVVNKADRDAIAVAIVANSTDAKYDVNGDGAVDVLDVLAVVDNIPAGAPGAPTLLGMKLSLAEVDRLQEQVNLLIATDDRSPAAMRTLIYLQQLIATARPEKTQLLANYPNPFNPETWIPYELATDTDVRLTIYNAQGVVIRTLQLGQQSAGYYTDRERAAYWDGRNALGEQVASGIYFYQLETDTMSSMRKMVILK